MFSHFERDLSCFDMCMRRTFFEAHTTRYEATIFHVVFFYSWHLQLEIVACYKHRLLYWKFNVGDGLIVHLSDGSLKLIM
jgi:hypothetical protein